MKETKKPYGDRVIFKQIDVEYKTAGGLFLGELEKDRETVFGKVIAVGPGRYIDNVGLIATTTQVGDIIVMRHNAPIRVNVKGEFLYVINESNLLFKLEDDEVIEKEFKTEGMEFAVGGMARVLS